MVLPLPRPPEKVVPIALRRGGKGQRGCCRCLKGRGTRCCRLLLLLRLLLQQEVRSWGVLPPPRLRVVGRCGDASFATPGWCAGGGQVQGAHGSYPLSGTPPQVSPLACTLSCPPLTSDRMALCCPWAMSRPPMLTSYRHAWGGEWKARGGEGWVREGLKAAPPSLLFPPTHLQVPTLGEDVNRHVAVTSTPTRSGGWGCYRCT